MHNLIVLHQKVSLLVSEKHTPPSEFTCRGCEIERTYMYCVHDRWRSDNKSSSPFVQSKIAVNVYIYDDRSSYITENGSFHSKPKQ